jgi:hypothetical protein
VKDLRVVDEEAETVRVEPVCVDEVGPGQGIEIGLLRCREPPVVRPPASQCRVQLAQPAEELEQVPVCLGLFGLGGGIGRIHGIPSMASAEAIMPVWEPVRHGQTAVSSRTGGGDVTIWLVCSR